MKDKRGIATELIQLGWALIRVGDYGQAAARLEESLAVFREVGDSEMIAWPLAALGELAVRRELEDKWGIGASLGSIGWVALCQRDFKRMRALLKESLTMRIETGDRGGIAWCLEKLAGAASLQGQKKRQRACSERRQPCALR